MRFFILALFSNPHSGKHYAFSIFVGPSFSFQFFFQAVPAIEADVVFFAVDLLLLTCLCLVAKITLVDDHFLPFLS